MDAAAAPPQSPPTGRRKRIFITAAEASGDQHAAELVRSLKQLDPSLEIEGLGGSKMAAAGVKLLEETVGKAAMGWRGALRALEASRWMELVSRRYRESRPDLHICVDSSAINLPFARLAKEKFGVPVLYYIAPQLWASREGRMTQMREFVDHVACIFPFEEAYFRSHGVQATFVGHPLFDELPVDRTAGAGVGPRFPHAPPVIGIIPGSRRSEVEANLPHLIEVMDGIRREFSTATFLVPTTSASNAPVQDLLRGRADVTVKQDGFDDLVPRCDFGDHEVGNQYGACCGVAGADDRRLPHQSVTVGAGGAVGGPHAEDRDGQHSCRADRTRAGVYSLVRIESAGDRVRAGVSSASRAVGRPARETGCLMAPIDRPGASANAAKLALSLMTAP
jgi:hypothetical protein